MQATNCPICYEPLEVLDVSPCMDCGCLATDLDHASAGKHTYAEYRIFGDLSLVLCDFCSVDFSSYDPTYFGLQRGARIGPGERAWQFVRDVPAVIAKDKCCTHCNRRLKFLEFLLHARELHNAV
jgi:hypothetical protein